jgi:hypothetical protein
MESTADDRERAGHAGRISLRGCVRLLVVFALAPWFGLLLLSAPAEALNQHALAGVFGKSFEEGAVGTGGSLAAPNAVAVNEATGDVYVLDKGNDRVVRFGPSHEFIEAWGFGVKAGGKAYEQCLAGEKCRVGTAGFGHGQFDEPEGIAVDNDAASPSHGDVYVIANSTTAKAAVDKFTSTGGLVELLPLKDKEALGPVDGVAVDTGGTVWVESEDGEEDFEITRFTGAAKAKQLGEPAELGVPDEDEELPAPGQEIEPGSTFVEPRPVRPGFAIDAKDDLFITYSPDGLDSQELEPETGGKASPPETELDHPCEPHACYVAEVPVIVHEQTVEEAEVPAGVERLFSFTAEVDADQASGVAVDPASVGELSQTTFVDEATSVGVFTPESQLLERFASEQLHSVGGGRGLAVNGATGEALLANAQSGQVEQYGFAARKPGAPTFEPGSVFPANAGPNGAEARAVIEPAGATTRYRVQYGEVECAGHESSCKEASASAKEEEEGFGLAKEGFGDQEVKLRLPGLSPSTVYHFRLIAENEFALGASAVVSEEHSFVTQSSPTEAALLDGRSWELVSPGEKKHGALIYPIRKEGGQIQAAEDGEAIVYTASSPIGTNIPGGFHGPDPAQLVATREASRGSEPWTTEDITTGNPAPSTGIAPGNPLEYQYFSGDLSAGLLDQESIPSPRLNEGEVAPPSGETTEELEAPAGRDLYVRYGEQSECANDYATKAPCFVPIVRAADYGREGPLSLAQATVEFEAATPSFKHVFFTSTVPLTSNAVPGDNGLYMWTGGGNGRIQLISVVPGTDEAQDTESKGLASVGARIAHDSSAVERMATTAVSEPGGGAVVNVFWNDDNKLFLTTVSPERAARSQGTEPEIESESLTEPNTGVTPPASATNEEPPLFETAPPDGSAAFFEDREQLTANAHPTTKAEFEASDQTELTGELYAFEAGRLAGRRVTDLSPDLIPGESANIVGGPLGAGDTDTGEATVYFVADGVLSDEPGPAGERATPGACFISAPGSHTCNLYAAHRTREGVWQPPRFIAQLSAADEPDWGGSSEDVHVSEYAQRSQTSRVSPNGKYVAFMSDRRLLGYDNTDANSGMPDEEVYVYDYADNSLVCASCNPSGAQPVGVEDQTNAGEGEGLLVDRTEAFAQLRADHWLAGSLPTWTTYGSKPASYQSRYLSNEGQLFFDSADALVNVAQRTRPETVTLDGATTKLQVGVENVYEYEPVGAGSCGSESANKDMGKPGQGCVQLISSGESENESAFIDASASGGDVFFITDAKLSVLESEHDSYAIYDARECHLTPEGELTTEGEDRCAPSPIPPAPLCQGEECRPEPEETPELAAVATGSPSGSSNLNSANANLRPTVSVLGKKESKHPTLTRAQLEAKALAVCRRQTKKSKRVACERNARKKYGARSKPKGSKARTGSHNAGRPGHSRAGR